MKKRYYSLFSICFLFFIHLHAAHLIGGEVTYKCIGQNEYEFTMKIYRDCFGGGAFFDSSPGAFSDATISVYKGTETTPYINSIVLNGPIISEIIPVIPDPCLVPPPDICVEEGIYVFTLMLPSDPESYYIVYQRCCRNQTINNIITPGEVGTTHVIEIKPEAQYNNSCQNNTPTFNDFPPIIICANEPINFDHSASDDDGDELVYKFCSPLKGGGVLGTSGAGCCPTDFGGVTPDPDAPPPYEPVDFIAPVYSPTNPMGGSPQVTIDEQSGLITGVPNVLGQFVVGVCVDEFRNGQLLSSIRRDFQFNVKQCSTPLIDAEFELVVDNTTVEFANQSSNAVSYEWDFGDGNSSTEESPIHDYGASGTYAVILSSYNNVCELIDSRTKEVNVGTTSLEERNNVLDVLISPNPTDGNFYVKIDDPMARSFQIELWNVNGQLVNSFFMKNNSTDQQLDFDHSNLAKGIYFLKIKNEEVVKVERLVIQ